MQQNASNHQTLTKCGNQGSCDSEMSDCCKMDIPCILQLLVITIGFSKILNDHECEHQGRYAKTVQTNNDQGQVSRSYRKPLRFFFDVFELFCWAPKIPFRAFKTVFNVNPIFLPVRGYADYNARAPILSLS